MLHEESAECLVANEPGQPASIEYSDQRGHACVGDLVVPEEECLERLEVVLAEVGHQRGEALVTDLASGEEQSLERG